MVLANLNGSYHSAIIGMDAQFTNQVSVQGNIDRVERALYLGTIPDNVVSKIIDEEQNHRPAEESDFTQFSMENCQQAVDRMATANQLNSSNIPSGITLANLNACNVTLKSPCKSPIATNLPTEGYMPYSSYVFISGFS